MGEEILAERGVPLRLGPETLVEARAELDGLQEMRQGMVYSICEQ